MYSLATYKIIKISLARCKNNYNPLPRSPFNSFSKRILIPQILQIHEQSNVNNTNRQPINTHIDNNLEILLHVCSKHLSETFDSPIRRQCAKVLGESLRINCMSVDNDTLNIWQFSVVLKCTRVETCFLTKLPKKVENFRNNTNIQCTTRICKIFSVFSPRLHKNFCSLQHAISIKFAQG